MRLTKAETAELQRLARQAARAYARRYSHTDVEDLAQEAWLAFLPALDTYDPARAGPGGRRGYLWRVAIRRLHGYLWRGSKPVACARDDLEALRPIVSETLEVLDLEVSDDAPVDDQVDEILWATRARRAIDGAFQALDRETATLAEGMITRDTMPAEVARATGRSVASVYRLRDRALLNLASSPEVHAVWADRRTG